MRWRRSHNDSRAAPSSIGESARRLLAERRRALPWSDRSILLVSLLLVVLAVPLWLDPETLSEVAGQGSPASPTPSGLDLVTPPPSQPTPGASQSAVLVARDAFSRSVDGSWGNADLGGEYVASGHGGLSVEEGSAFVRLGPGDAGTNVLPALAVGDGALEYTVSLERLPPDGGVVVYSLLRVTADGSFYRLALHFSSAGQTYVGVETVVDGQARRIGEQVLISTAASVAPPSLHVRAEAVGNDPTTVRLRAWSDGHAEPTGWQASVIDWTGALQRSGAMGVGWWLDQVSSERMALGFLDLSAWRLGDGT